MEALNGSMRHLADELHDLVEVVLLLQDLAHDLADVDKVGVELVVEGLQRLGVLAVADQPVDAREVLALRQLLVQAPEDLRKAASAKPTSTDSPARKTGRSQYRTVTAAFAPLQCFCSHVSCSWISKSTWVALKSMNKILMIPVSDYSCGDSVISR